MRFRLLCLSHLLFGISVLQLCSGSCSIADVIGSGKEVDVRFENRNKCTWTIKMPVNGKDYRFEGQIKGRSCHNRRLSIKVNGKEICTDSKSRNILTECMASAEMTVIYRKQRNNDKGFTMTYNITPCYKHEDTTNTMTTKLSTSASRESTGSQTLVAVFVPVLVVLLAALIAMFVYVRYRHNNRAGGKDNNSTEISTIDTAISNQRQYHQELHGYHNAGADLYYSTIDDNTYSTVPEPTHNGQKSYHQLNHLRGGYNTSSTSDGAVSTGNPNVNTNGPSAPQSVSVENVLYGGS